MISSGFQTNPSNNIHPVRLQRGRKPYSCNLFNLAREPLAPKYSKMLPITKEKTIDIQALTKLMPADAAKYYTDMLKQIETKKDKQENVEIDVTDKTLDYTS